MVMKSLIKGGKAKAALSVQLINKLDEVVSPFIGSIVPLFHLPHYRKVSYTHCLYGPCISLRIAA